MKTKNKSLNYYEGLSLNQVQIILRMFDIPYKEFQKYMIGRTVPIMQVYDPIRRRYTHIGGCYESDLIHFIHGERI